jgi:serine/threonine protein kinase
VEGLGVMDAASGETGIMSQGLCPQCGGELLAAGDLLQCPQCNRVMSLVARSSTCLLEPRWDRETVADSLPAGGDETPAKPGVTGLEFLDEVGAGGFGTVYRAIDKTLDREVAVKVLHRANSDLAARFETEAVITGNLQHQNIVPVHMAGCDKDGRRFFTMKILDGSTLADVIDKLAAGDVETARAFPLVRLLQIFLSVCDAISYAHSKGVIHRDLKPQNIMLGAYGEVYVLDWGLAKLCGTDEAPPDGASMPAPTGKGTSEVGSRFHLRLSRATHHTMDGVVLGTPGYMPPEQVLGMPEAMGERSDVFSLGAVLFEILTGELAIAGTGVNEILRNTTEGRIQPVKSTPRGRNAPPELAAVVRTALAVDPDERYQSVSALAQDVRNYLEDRSVSVAPDSWWRRAGRWTRHHRTLASTLGTAALIGFVALLAVFALMSHNALREAQLAREKAELAESKALAESRARKIEETERLRLQLQARASALYIKGLELAERGAVNAERADALLTQTLALDPEMFDAWRTRAVVRAGMGRTQDAIADYLEANRCYNGVTHRDNPEMLSAVGMIYWSQLADFKKASEFFERASRSDPDNALAQFAGGILAFMNGDRDDAITQMKATVARNATFWEGHYALGMMYMGNTVTEANLITGGSKGVVDVPGAIAAFTQAIELNPTYARLYILRAQAKVNLYYSRPQADTHLLEEHLVDYVAAVKLQPKSFEAHLCRMQGNYYITLLAKDLARRFKTAEACEEEITSLHELLAGNPELAQRQGAVVGYETARFRVLQNKLGEALKEITAALALEPNNTHYAKLKTDIDTWLSAGARSATR